MAGVRHTLRASTLAETLVMMLVAGIVFLVATEALTLFSRLIARRTTALVENGRQSDGIFRIGQLLIAADSIKEEFGGGESLRLYRAGHETRLSSVDSTVLYAAGAFRDTLYGSRHGRDRSGEPPAEISRAAPRMGTIRNDDHTDRKRIRI